MDNNEMKGQGVEGSKCPCGHGGCMCGGMWGMHGHHHRGGRLIVRLLIALFIFWCGFQLGELKGMFGHRGYGMMGGRGGYYGAPTMMGGYYTAQGTAIEATTTPRQ